MSRAGAQRSCFEVFTLFPAAIEGFVGAGLLGKAIERGRVEVRCTDFRDFTHDRHRSVDDAPFGGGAGMVMTPGPVVEAMEHVARERGPFHRIVLTPSAPRFDQRVAARLATLPRIGLLCGRYEGIDDRVRESFADECLSLGDFVLGGGEVAALVVIEAISRLVDGVVGNPQSVHADSFGRSGEAGQLEHPHYTRPALFRGLSVPPVLLGGDHAAIARWRREAALRRTWELRPELRPRRRLASDHAIYVAVPAEALAEARALAEVAREHDAALVVLGAESEALSVWLEATAGRVEVALLADGRALKRRLRRGGSGQPRVVHVLGSEAPGLDEPTATTHLGELLDLLAIDDEPVGPLVLWIGSGPVPGWPVHAVYAPIAPVEPTAEDLTLSVGHGPRRGLAKRGVIADISPPAARMAGLAHTALTRLRDRG